MESGQTLQGSFSSVSKPMIATKYICWKPLAEIYTMHSFAPLSNLKIFVKISPKNCYKLLNLTQFLQKIADILPKFRRNLPNFPNHSFISLISVISDAS